MRDRTGLNCPGCPTGRRPAKHRLCPDCWAKLPQDTRRRLTRRDGLTDRRVKQLRTAIATGTPLGVIRVTR
ncbi:hypothetical protein AB0M11_08230 [Streptomyces sp. NPDC051987]|uniref:hypothetical protein n=1 Tax=Streptomyces sp. NPDC051987 TaxID=3155808 RepID=UPI003434F8BB